MKVCAICSGEFSPAFRHPHQLYCSQKCNDAAYYERNKMAFSRKARVRNSYNVEQRRAKHYRVAYGITLDQKAERIRQQGGCCAACGTTDPGQKGWHTDHDHETDKLRGELCGNCNRALGYAQDSIERLYKLITYLERYSSDEVS